MIENLTIIGETINASIPSIHTLFEEHNLSTIVEIARAQETAGAMYIDVNIGTRDPGLMGELIPMIQEKVTKPLSIDTPDYETAKRALEAYDPDKACGTLPILNSISPLRMELFELYHLTPFQPLLMVSERRADNKSQPNKTAEETYNTVLTMIEYLKAHGYSIPVDHIIVDTGIAPIGTDVDGSLKRVLDSITLIHSDPSLKGIRTSVGLSNFTVMLPPQCADGSLLRSSLESAFLTLAMPLGLDTIIGSVKRNYTILPRDHAAVICLKDVLVSSGYDAVGRIIEYYS